MKVAVVNYGMGNLASVRRALEDLGAHAYVANAPGELEAADRFVLPGVGAFSQGMGHLQAGGWFDALRAGVGRGRPLLGICLGMQMLAAWGEEGGPTRGLGLVPGRIRRLNDLGCTQRIPHVGWNEIALADDAGPLLAHIPTGSDFYFVHSYGFVADEATDVIATTDYGIEVPAAVQRGHVFGTQFHPEKSSRAGRQLLENFLRYPSC
jgi:glutamine amidotransferase